MKWTRLAGAGFAALGAVTAYDLTQKRHAILRNFPVVGHARFLLERFGPELRQYIVTGNDDERPFSRDQRRWVYASSKLENNYFGFGSDNDMERGDGYPVIKHRTFDRAGRTDGDPRRRGGPAAVGQDSRRPPRPHPCLPAELRRQHLGDELRGALQERHRGAEPRCPRGRLPPEHRRGCDLAVPPHGRRPGLPARDVVLRLSRQGRRVRAVPPQGPRRVRSGEGDRGQAVAGRQARPRRAAPRGEGQSGDRRDPRHRDGCRLRLAQPAHRVLRRRLDGRLRRAARDRDRPPRGHQERGRQPGVLGPPRAADGRATARRRLRQHRRRRGRHGRVADDLRRRRRLPLPGRLRRASTAASRGPGSPTT